MTWLWILKPALWIAVAGFLWWQVSGWLDKYEDRNRQISELVTQRDQAVIAAESLQDALEERKQHEERLELLLTEAIEKIDATRADAQKEHDAFKGHDLDNLATRKAKLIERLVNNATDKRMRDVETALNH